MTRIIRNALLLAILLIVGGACVSSCCWDCKADIGARVQLRPSDAARDRQLFQVGDELYRCAKEFVFLADNDDGSDKRRGELDGAITNLRAAVQDVAAVDNYYSAKYSDYAEALKARGRSGDYDFYDDDNGG